MSAESLDAVPLWIFLLVAIGVLCLAMESGYRLGKWRHARRTDERDQPVGAIVASILGLLALVLGFTFQLSASRFDARRQAVLEEAEAIHTTYLRARVLPEPQRREVANLLREYVDVRIRGIQEKKAANVVAKSEELHELLWEQAVLAAEKDPQSEMIAAFLQSLNEVINLHSKRVFVGMHSRIPFVIWAWLAFLSILGMMAVGYHAALSATRRSPVMVGLVLTFATVLLLIADLDRGHEGFLQVSQQAMVDLQRTMKQPQP